MPRKSNKLFAGRLLSTAEVATILDVNIQTVRRYCREGKIQTVHLGTVNEGPGKRYRVTEQAVQAFLHPDLIQV